MRALKFRVWDNFHSQENPCFWYSDRMKLWEFWTWVEQHPGKAEKNIQEFAGLTDVRAQEIYEGDILKLNRGKTYESNYTVVWKKNAACFYLVSATGEGDKYGLFTKTLDSDMIRRDNAEIIGNIFQTPELTK